MARSTQQTAGAVLPSLRIPAATRYPSEWASVPMRARVLHAMAHASGLAVAHTSEPMYAYLSKDYLQGRTGFLWIGTVGTFKGCGMFKPSTNWAFIEWGSTETGEGLRVDLLRPNAGEDVIVAFHDGYAPIGRKSFGRFAAMAAADGDYQAFREAVLRPVEVSVAKGEVWEEWRGAVEVCFPADLLEHFKRCGDFGPIRRAAKASATLGLNPDAAQMVCGYVLDLCRTVAQWRSPEWIRKGEAWASFAEEIAAALRANKGRQHG